MRVLHLYSGNLFGGIESILLSLASRPAGQIHHEFALCFHGRLERELTALGASVRHLGPVRMSRPASAVRARKALAKLLTSGSYDRVICHAPWAHGLFGGIARKAGVPLVFWAHDAMTGRHWTEKLARRVSPDLVICNSRFTAGTLPMLYPTVASAVVYAPVANAPFPLRESRRAIRAELQTADDAIVIVSACRSERWKGHLLLVEALGELKSTSKWIWWQAGGAQRPSEEQYLRRVKQAARTSGVFDRVRWLGERHDVPALLASADLYCQPNLEPEPFGMVFVEALAAGLPVVTSASGGALEIVDQSCGRLVAAGDRAALASTLKELIADRTLRGQLAAAAPERARRLCDPMTFERRLFEVLNGMATPAVRRTPVAVGA